MWRRPRPCESHAGDSYKSDDSDKSPDPDDSYKPDGFDKSRDPDDSYERAQSYEPDQRYEHDQRDEPDQLYQSGQLIVRIDAVKTRNKPQVSRRYWTRTK
ncbi:hypothetical protein OK015_09310 [Mycobacterium sp. Aquia_216]|uniref:hypothetical protein n=1 Tax=Mycobacterium sp. Aquia_216 TaxID=2991729 RepID=UPI00227ACDCD|nr:hypothetical protein [Mycobacterium sp. Aquia_216]WAJ46629.1 hypothetical protein OK015_09310 [Mycobacterium sp. Aquia_216]